ncbi:MAG TPA: M20/M25/M40 family metallo-hydrolase [Sphingomonadaceae bacterium]|nr:M20/M25/M40 family metallo-hydrolase [Sphingomonadaceae bacterium]
MRYAPLSALALLAAPVGAQDLPATSGGQSALEILAEAIEVPTVQGRGRVPELAALLERRLLDGGFAREAVAFTPIGENGYLTALYPGKDSSAPKTVILVHMDVVEARPEDWERDPFTAIVEDGFVFGRGALDNKADMAMSMAALFELKQEGWQPRADLVLLITGDEETAMQAAPAAAEAIPNVGLVLNGDGGEGELLPDGTPIVYKIQAAEKTYADIRLSVTDPGGHSSRPDDTNPIAMLSEALLKIANYRFEPQLSPITKAFWEVTAARAPQELADAMRAFAADPGDQAAIATLSAAPEYVGLVRTTCVPTMVSGGHAPNALPQSASANVNCRIFPGQVSRGEIAGKLAEIAGNPAITFELLDDGSIEAPASPLVPELMAAVERAVHERAPGLAITPAMEAGATDSIFFRARGIPAFGVSAVFMKPDDNYAHGLNERLPLATLDPGVRQWKTLLRALLD